MTREAWGQVLRRALRIFAFMVAFGLVGFIALPVAAGAGPLLRIPLVGALILGAWALMFMEGSSAGERDSALTETLDRLEGKEGYVEKPEETGRRFHRLKGVLGPLLGAMPLFLAAVYLALTAVPFAYALQDLPGWLTPYLNRPEVGGPLVYMQDTAPVVTATDYVRIFVRFMLFPYVSILGDLTDAMSLLLDRLSPLLALLMPAFAAIGYQFGPRRRAKYVKIMEETKRQPRKRLKKDRRKKQQGPGEKKQLV